MAIKIVEVSSIRELPRIVTVRRFVRFTPTTSNIVKSIV